LILRSSWKQIEIQNRPGNRIPCAVVLTIDAGRAAAPTFFAKVATFVAWPLENHPTRGVNRSAAFVFIPENNGNNPRRFGNAPKSTGDHLVDAVALPADRHDHPLLAGGAATTPNGSAGVTPASDWERTASRRTFSVGDRRDACPTKIGLDRFGAGRIVNSMDSVGWQKSEAKLEVRLP
jgi:hypothetical protein